MKSLMALAMFGFAILLLGCPVTEQAEDYRETYEDEVYYEEEEQEEKHIENPADIAGDLIF